MLEQALHKLDTELAAAQKVDRKSGIMAKPVADALKDFCRQDREFAEAVVQGGSFSACMSAVCKGVVGAISDLDAYRRAVQFFFPGADIRFHMTIDLCASVAEDVKPEPGGGMILDLSKWL